MYFLKPVEGTEHHLEDISNNNLCIAELERVMHFDRSRRPLERHLPVECLVFPFHVFSQY